MNTQQLNLFPQGDDLPLFSGTPIPTRIEPYQPREVETPTPLPSIMNDGNQELLEITSERAPMHHPS